MNYSAQEFQVALFVTACVFGTAIYAAIDLYLMLP